MKKIDIGGSEKKNRNKNSPLSNPFINSQHSSNDALSVYQITHEIQNQLNYMLGNSQIILDIWKDMDKIFSNHIDEYKNIFICGIPIHHLNKVVTKMLKDIIKGTLKINSFAKIIKVLDSREKL